MDPRRSALFLIIGATLLVALAATGILASPPTPVVFVWAALAGVLLVLGVAGGAKAPARPSEHLRA